MNFSTESYKKSSIHEDFKNFKSITIDSESKLYKMLLSYIPANKVNDEGLVHDSFEIEILPKKTKEENKDALDGLSRGRIGVKLGYGTCCFRSFKNETFYAIHQHIGEPVGLSYEVKVYSNLILLTNDKTVENLAQFLSDLLDMSETNTTGTFQCFHWSTCNEYWKRKAMIKARPMDSVVLPKAIKTRLMKDLEKFLSPTTEKFYNRNGIPYRRSYLFYGLPGTGKTSMIQALAGHFHRSVSYLMPTHPKMTDDSLREAINSLPSETIAVLEDIDSLFSKDRTNKVLNSTLTFSGLLNALDGIGDSKGQIFILTTNLREQLDHALIRNGRVDLHIEFTYAIKEQMIQMWNNFYPESTLGPLFADQLDLLLSEHELQVTTANLQHYFICQMDHTDIEALQEVMMIIDEIKLNNAEQQKLQLIKEEQEKLKLVTPIDNKLTKAIAEVKEVSVQE